MKVQLLIIASLFLIFNSCNTIKQTSGDKPEAKVEIPSEVIGCNAIAKVRNFTHEAGCQYLLELEDGTLLLPGILPNTKAPFYEGAGLKIGYKILDKDEKVKDNSMCKSHNYVVEVTCLEQYIIPEEGMPASHKECVSIKNPYKFNWMREAINQHKPTRVNEFEYSIGYIYEMKTEKGSKLFDCLGNFMCDTSDNTDCQSLLETLSNPKVILVVNN